MLVERQPFICSSVFGEETLSLSLSLSRSILSHMLQNSISFEGQRKTPSKHERESMELLSKRTYWLPEHHLSIQLKAGLFCCRIFLDLFSKTTYLFAENGSRMSSQ